MYVLAFLIHPPEKTSDQGQRFGASRLRINLGGNWPEHNSDLPPRQALSVPVGLRALYQL